MRKGLQLLCLIFAVVHWAATDVFAAQDLTLVRMARTTAMGGAGVGLADDENALFQNPAGLAGLEDRRFKLISAGIEASFDTYTTFATSMDAFSNFSASTLNTLMGKDINFRFGQTTMVMLPKFTLAYLVDVQGSMNEYNLANPNFDFGYMTTHGLQVGTAWSFASGRRPTSEFRLGVAGKMLWRRGGYYNISTSGFLQATNQGKAYIDNLVGGFGLGFGADVGLQYVNKLDPQTKLMGGFSVTDILDTRFASPRANPIPMALNLGFGWKRMMDFGTLSLALDFKNLTKTMPFVNKTHFGGELKLSTFDIYVGMNQLNYTWGFALDVWVLKTSVLSTAEELGYAYRQNPSRRYMLMVDFNLPI